MREAARIQSFPDDYVFLGSIGFQQQQVADAVPPKLAEAVAQALLAANRRARRAPTKMRFLRSILRSGVTLRQTPVELYS